jgi:hypothetical protein
MLVNKSLFTAYDAICATAISARHRTGFGELVEADADDGSDPWKVRRADTQRGPPTSSPHAEAKRVFPSAEPERHRAMKIAAMGVHMAEKAVRLFCERRCTRTPSQMSDEPLPRSDCRCARGRRKRPRGPLDPVLVLRSHGSRRYRGRDGTTLHRRRASQRGHDRGPPSDRRAMRAFQTIAQKFIPPARWTRIFTMRK